MRELDVYFCCILGIFVYSAWFYAEKEEEIKKKTTSWKRKHVYSRVFSKRRHLRQRWSLKEYGMVHLFTVMAAWF
jgi:hypothetical protein